MIKAFKTDIGEYNMRVYRVNNKVFSNEKSQREYLEWLLDKILQNGMKGFHLPRGSCDDPLT